MADAGLILRAWMARLRGDQEIPGSPDGDLEDHSATFITDIGLALRALGQSPRTAAESVEALRDSRAILAVVAERHGAQRARLGWPAAAVIRELDLLGEVLDAAVLRLAGPANIAAAESARAVVAQLLAQSLRVSLGGFRLAGETEPMA